MMFLAFMKITKANFGLGLVAGSVTTMEKLLLIFQLLQMIVTMLIHLKIILPKFQNK